MNKKLILVPIISLFLAGCGITNTTKLVTGSAVTTNITENTIEIKNFTFNPSDITVNAGDVIQITNSDTTAHTVTADDGSFDTGTINPGETRTLPLPNKDGKFGFHCSLHPYMRGSITITGTPTPTPTD